MIKKNKLTLIITTLVSLIPILVGLLLWDQLPEQLPTHWNINGEVDAWSSKGFAVFGLPCIIAALHWLCVFASYFDTKNREYHPKAATLVLWICPSISLLLGTLQYAAALGLALRVQVILPLFLGLLMVIIGNLLPKMRQSYTMGIKLPWTLNNEENWNKTHRFASKLWVACGIVIMATAVLGSFWFLLGVLVVMVVAPTVYSYLYYRKHRGEQK